MFDPVEFCNLASRLCSPTSDEATLRTSISRSYYSVFLSAREKLDALGHYHPTGLGEDHAGVRIALARIGQRDLSNKVLGLIRSRTKADYDLSIIVSQSNAQRVLQIAQNLLPRIASLS